MQPVDNTPTATPTSPTLTPQQEVVLASAVARIKAAIGAGIVEHPHRRWERRHEHLNNASPTSSISNSHLRANYTSVHYMEAPTEAPALEDVPRSP